MEDFPSVKMSVRVRAREYDDLRRIETQLVGKTMSRLMREAIGLLIAKYPDVRAIKEQMPLFVSQVEEPEPEEPKPEEPKPINGKPVKKKATKKKLAKKKLAKK